ncbi:MAG: ATP-binding protein [Candidatus Thermoplasmatota archaeon]|nr:ATP-binding protein [Candidatus Thermoplasmatota archaeon]
MGIKEKKEFSIKKLLFSKLNSKLTIIFLLFLLLVLSISIYFFYTMIESSTVIVLPETVEVIKIIVLIIILIAINTVIISFFISRFISKPIVKIYNATKEIEKGNYNVNLDIKTGDEIEMLSKAFNQTTLALGKMAEERKELDSAKTEFLSMTSHELRSPMTPMKVQLQMLEEGYFGKLSKKQKESINIIARNADRLDNIICDFLEISRIEAARLRFDFRETDIVQTIRETVKFMDGFAKEKNIKLEIDVGEIPIILADPDRISQVLRNLINNAIKFSNENSNIIISAHKKDDYILFSVHDYGCGLTPENQIRVFEPFYQVENANRNLHDGTGLGLAVCRGIVKSQKGKIWVKSKINHGSKFYFTFPLNPVREIEPIKVLFSQKKIIDKKVKEELEVVDTDIITEKNKENKIKKLKFDRSIFKMDVKRLLNPREEKRFKTKIKLNKQNNTKLEDKWSEHKFDAVFIFDENANILDCNENMSKILGYTKSEILSLNLLDIGLLESKKDILDKIKKTKKDGIFSFKTIHKRKDGSVILVYENLQYNKNKNQFKSIVREDYSHKKSSK